MQHKQILRHKQTQMNVTLARNWAMNSPQIQGDDNGNSPINLHIQISMRRIIKEEESPVVAFVVLLEG